MWDSVPLLSTIGNVAIYVALAAALLGGLAGAIGAIASNRANDITTRLSSEKIAKADARAAEANARAEEARTETKRIEERLQKHQEMRRLTDEQKAALRPILESDLFQKEPRPLLFVSRVADAEAESFAVEIADFLDSCGVPQSKHEQPFIFQRIDVPEGLIFSVNTTEPTPENQPLICFHNAAKAVGLKMGLMVDPRLRPNQGCISVLRKSDV